MKPVYGRLVGILIQAVFYGMLLFLVFGMWTK